MKKKGILIFIVLVISLNGYTQTKTVEDKYKKPAEALFLEAITENNLSQYEYFAKEKYTAKLQHGRHLLKGKKNVEVLNYIEKRASDSIKVYYKRQEEIRLKNQRIRQIADSVRRDSIQRIRIAEEIVRAKKDSMRIAKQHEFFSIGSIVENIGKDAYSKENIENSLRIYPVGYQGTSTFYELDDMFITVKYVGLEDIAIELGFRLFGEDASFYKKELMLAGFKYQKSFNETMLGDNSQGYSYLSNTEIQRYRKFTGKEYVICDIYYDRFTFFKFYRARYKK